MPKHLCAVIVIAIVACQTTAQEAESSESGWQIDLTPYLFLPDIVGDAGKGPLTLPVADVHHRQLAGQRQLAIQKAHPPTVVAPGPVARHLGLTVPAPRPTQL